MVTIMRRHLGWVGSIFLLSAIGFLALNWTGQLAWTKDTKKFSTRSKAALEARKEQIDQELNTLKGHAWAGTYYYGDGLGVNVDLRLAPKSGFAFTWNGCLGLYDLNYGDVVEADGRIKLAFKYPNDRKYFGIAPELIPIVWGERHYLIPTDEVVKFANAINSGFEPTKTLTGSFLLRRGDELKAVRGQPNIPREYSDYLLKEPVRAEISAVKDSRVENTTRTTTVVLNVGSVQGVKQGMEFYVYSPSTVLESATITSANRSNSEAEIIQYSVNERSERPSLDWKLSTFVGPE
jgi:hypothetical protein